MNGLEDLQPLYVIDRTARAVTAGVLYISVDACISASSKVFPALVTLPPAQWIDMGFERNVS